jgi:hypothetical protein
LLRYDVETSSIFSFAATIPQKNENLSRKTRCDPRKYTGFEEDARRVLTSILSISELWMRQQKAFYCGVRPAWFLCGAQYPSEAWAARKMRVTQQSINTSRHIGTNRFLDE